MRILWVNPSFLDYRIAVFKELDLACQRQLSVVYSRRRIPDRVQARVAELLGERAYGLVGEKTFSLGQPTDGTYANRGLCVPYQKGLWRTVRSIDADVVIGEGFFQWTPVALAKSLLQNRPLIISYERTRHTERNCPRWRTLYRQVVLKRASAVICNGSLSRDYLVSLGYPSTRIVMGGMAADSSLLSIEARNVDCQKRFDLMQRFALQHPVFMSVGQLIERKGMIQLLAGWRQYIQKPDASGSLLLVGDGELRNRLEEEVKTSGIKNVAFAGNVPYEQIAAYYATADVFINASLEDNWSLVVPEAMACGLPAGCSVFNGCWPELIRKDINGITFNPLESASVEGCFRYFLQRSGELLSMGKESQRIETSYGPPRAAQAILSACQLAKRPQLRG